MPPFDLKEFFKGLPFLIQVIIVFQGIFFALFWIFVFQMQSQFHFIENMELDNLKANLTRLKKGGECKGEFEIFIFPYLLQPAFVSDQPQRSDIYARVMAGIVRYEEMARTMMNGLIILGLIGTVGSIAWKYVLNIEGVPLNFLAILPPAFIPSTLGLFFAVVASVILSMRIIGAYKAADSITDKIMLALPEKQNMTEALQEIFSGEFKKLLADLPGTITTSMVNIRNLAEEFWTARVTPFAEAIGQMRESIQDVRSAVTEFKEHTSAFSDDFRTMAKHTSKGQKAIVALVESLTEASEKLMGSIQASSQLVTDFEARYRSILEIYTQHLSHVTIKYDAMSDDIAQKINGFVDAFDARMLNQLTTLSCNLQVTSQEHLIKVGTTFEDSLRRLYEETERRNLEVFSTHLEQIKSIEEGLRCLNKDLNDFNASFTASLAAMREMAGNVKEWQDKFDAFNRVQQGIAQANEKLIHDLSSTILEMREYLKQMHDERVARFMDFEKKVARMNDLLAGSSKLG